MRRREFVASLGSAVAWPIVVGAQQPPKLPTIGFASVVRWYDADEVIE